MARVPQRYFTLRLIIAVTIMIVIAAIHGFRLGTYLDGNYYILYYSYASDIMLPFGFYFLLCLNEIQLSFLKPWFVKAIIVFGAMLFSEVMQYFDIYFFGTTFDTMDIFMYALGTMLAVVVDRVVLRRLIPLWSYRED